MKNIKNYFAKNINTKNNTPQQGRFVNKTSGFTIIEVALVLAIAGLIFLVVFLALPALQNSQKDTARRQDVGRIVSALSSMLVDNQGSLPPTTGGWDYSGNIGTASIQSYTGKLSIIQNF